MRSGAIVDKSTDKGSDGSNRRYRVADRNRPRKSLESRREEENEGNSIRILEVSPDRRISDLASTLQNTIPQHFSRSARVSEDQARRASETIPDGGV